MRRPEGFNLAFLDIMACGLGAVVLVLVLLQNTHQAAKASPAVSTDALEDELAQVELALQQATEAANASSKAGSDKQQINAQQLAKAEAIKVEISAEQSRQQALTAQIKQLSSELETKKKALIASAVETQSTNNQEYVIGLEVKGKKIVILVDTSASMTARKLLDITLYKSRSIANRAKAAKWLRTKRTVGWLLARLPETSFVKVIAFNEKPRVINKTWVSAKSVSGLASIQASIAQLDPKGGTNLEKAIQSSLSQEANSIYVITDGLPTIGKRTNSIIPSGDCGGPGSQQTVSGECRVSLFNDVEALTKNYRGSISTILLPLEGDPQAAPLFTKWSLASNGAMLSPAKEWP